ncbi:hypothetical protein PHMEG_00038405 [Phytophthora megakarya]|uniref:Uncharacterized protein n=1 Tax=Phytophthora megakarya TaxID=4795 RepID=A0A225UK82_9STRA|nr:hypothetical protein PHMEG_00038405 [Phytophthora megakarya]
MPPDYVKPDPRPPRGPCGGGGSGPKPSTPKPVRVLDLSGSGGGGQAPPARRHDLPERDQPLVPSIRCHNNPILVARPAPESRSSISRRRGRCAPRSTDPETISLAVLTRTWTQRWKRVPDGLLWDDLRQDVRRLMLTGLTYEEALKLLRGDEPIHHLLPGYMVQLMLAQMMDWGTLDFTSWSK